MTRNTALAGHPSGGTGPLLPRPASAAATRTVVLVGIDGRRQVGDRAAAGWRCSACRSATRTPKSRRRPAARWRRCSASSARRISGAGERRVVRRLLDGPPAGAGHRRRRVHGPGDPGGDPRARALPSGCGRRCRCCCAAWRLRRNRPLLANGDPAAVLQALMQQRYPSLCRGGHRGGLRGLIPRTRQPARVAAALAAWRPLQRLPVRTSIGACMRSSWVRDCCAGPGPCWRRCCRRSGWSSSQIPRWPPCTAPALVGRAGGGRVRAHDAGGAAGGRVRNRCHPTAHWPSACWTTGAERRTAVLALGGGVVGDLAGFVAATALRGHPFRAGADHAAGPGRFERGRQDRHQHQPGQEPARVHFTRRGW